MGWCNDMPVLPAPNGGSFIWSRRKGPMLENVAGELNACLEKEHFFLLYCQLLFIKNIKNTPQIGIMRLQQSHVNPRLLPDRRLGINGSGSGCFAGGGASLIHCRFMAFPLRACSVPKITVPYACTGLGLS